MKEGVEKQKGRAEGWRKGVQEQRKMEGRSNKLQIIINNLEQRNKKGKKKPGREVKKGKGRENAKKIEGQHSEELKEKG